MFIYDSVKKNTEHAKLKKTKRKKEKKLEHYLKQNL